METIIYGLLGGFAPALTVILVYVFGLAGRLAKIETNICF
jgi:hypothetical protein